MRHSKHHASLGVTREHREAMLSNLAVGLITHGRIETTLTKAKALRPFIEKVITKAKQAAAAKEKKDAVHLRRIALTKVRDKEAIALLFSEKYKDFANRAGGYTRIYKLSKQRIGDAAEMALIEFVKAEDTGYKKTKGKKAAKTKAPAEVPAEVPAPAEATAAASAETAAPAAPAAEAPAKTEGEAKS
jgi:large subunit ribosomal protein L17